jgi:uncharacterized RDD family membrane protein YckC
MKEVRYAGFWVRFVASFFDTLFLALPVAVVIYFLSDGNWFDFSQYQQNINYAMSGNAQKALANQPQTSMKWELIFEVSVLFVTMLFWKRWRGATPGKKFVNIKIVDAKTFQDIDNKQAITRSFGYIISTLTLLIGFIIVAFRKDKRGFHDLLAGTVVIYDDGK